MGLQSLLKGIVRCYKEDIPEKWLVEWKENNIFYRLECQENGARRFLLCSVRDGEGKRHLLIFPEERGLVRGWDLLTEKLRALEIQ